MDESTDSSGRATRRRQGAGDRRFYFFDFALRAVDEWTPDTQYSPDALVRPTQGQETGWYYTQGSTQGLSGPLEPTWPLSGPVADGSCTWTPIAPPATEDTIQSATWATFEPPDATLVLDGASTAPTTAGTYVSGGTPGFDYLARCTVTMTSGAVYTADLLMEIR